MWLTLLAVRNAIAVLMAALPVVVLGVTSLHRLAIDLGVSVPRVHDLVREKRGISGHMALWLARYWGNTPQFWMNLQSHYDLELARHRSGQEIATRVQPRPASSAA